MASLENLEIVIDVVEQFEDELDKLLLKLAEVELFAEKVDNITIDVDVRGTRQMDALMARMAMLETADLFDGGGGGGGAGRAAGNVAEATEEMSDSFFETDLRMTDLHNALAKIVPLLLTLIGAIPALVGALVVLAAAAIAAATALAALTGFAALGFAVQEGGLNDLTSGLADAWDEIRNDFLDAFVPLAERLAPLFEDALDGLDRFFQNLANEGDTLVALADDARDFGRWLIETVPSFLGDMAAFADVMAEAFGVLAEFGDEIDIFRAMAGFMADVLPAFMDFVSLVAALIPVILKMSIGFLQATNGVLLVVNALAQLFDLLGISEQHFGLLVGGALAAYSAMLLLNSALVATAVKGFLRAGQAAITYAVQLFGARAAAISAAFATRGLTWALQGLAAAVALTGIGAILVVLGGIASSALSASSGIDEATKSLKEFQRQQNRMSSGRNPYANPDIGMGEATGTSRFAGGGGGVSVTVEGDADDEKVRNQSHNALYRMERPIRGR